MKINKRFIVRSLIGFLAMLALALIGLVFALPRLFPGPPVGPTPRPPTIAAPAGPLPEGNVGLQEFAQYSDGDFIPVGSGFLLKVDETIVAAVTAHSLSIGDQDHLLKRVRLGVAGAADFVAILDTLHGQPGRLAIGPNMSVDYVLFQVASAVAAEYVLLPDERGGPQPGEAVVLFSGLGDKMFTGTIQAANPETAWAVFPDYFDPAQMSGSPFVSAYTGRVVGMAVGAAGRNGRLYIAMHPIGSLVEKARAADRFVRLIDY